MKKRFTEEQIIGFLKEAQAGVSVPDWSSPRACVRTVYREGLKVAVE